MERMTRRKDQYECRINGCQAEAWFEDLGYGCEDASYCNTCPFEKYINKLAEYEDAAENFENAAKNILKMQKTFN